MLYFFILGIVLGVVWTALQNWSTTSGVESGMYRLIIVGVFGSLSYYMSGWTMLAYKEDVTVLYVTWGLFVVAFGFLPVVVIFNTVEDWYYSVFPTKSIHQ